MKYGALLLVSMLQFIFLLYGLAQISEVMSFLTYRAHIQKQRADSIESYLCGDVTCAERH
jgi:hypothetical protein